MNNKGEASAGMVGTLIVVTLVLVVGAILFQASAQNVGQVRDLSTVANGTLGTLTNGTPTYITNYKYCTDFKIWNATNNVEIPSTNYTVTYNVVYNGQEAVKVDPSVMVTATGAFNKGVATYDGVCQPLTYDNTSGGRAISYLIVLMAALALGVVALTPALRSGVLDMLGR